MTFWWGMARFPVWVSGCPACCCEIVETAEATGEGGGLTKHQPPASADQNCQYFCCAVNCQPATEINGHAATCIEGHEGADRTAIIKQQQHGRNAKGETESKGQQTDPRIVGEQEGSEKLQVAELQSGIIIYDSPKLCVGGGR